MWVSSRARGCLPSSSSSSVGRHDSGPGSTSTSPTCQQPITRGRPRCMGSMTLIGWGCSSLGQRPGVVVTRLGRLGLEVDDRRRLGVVRVLVSELAFADVGGVLRLVFRKGGLLRDRALAGLRQSEEASRPYAGRLIGGGEAVSGRVGQTGELARELARVLDDLLALGPDPVGLGIEVLEP